MTDGASDDAPLPAAEMHVERRRRARLVHRLRSQLAWAVALGVVVLFAVAVAVVANGRGAPGAHVPSGDEASASSPPGVAGPTPLGTAKRSTTTRRGPRPVAPPGFPTLALTGLPQEAAATWQRIGAGGPFPHADDGNAFENTGGRLPVRPLGWYRAYATEIAEPHGRRLLVVGRDGSPYWTTDGGGTFVFVDVAR